MLFARHILALLIAMSSAAPLALHGAELTDAQKVQCLKTRLPLVGKPKPRYQTEGYFVTASDEAHARLAQTYNEAGVTKKIEGRVAGVQERDIAVSLEGKSEKQLERIRQGGRQAMREAYYFTSGAGLWSRGGALIKALLGYNVRGLLGPARFEQMVANADIANADSVEKVLKLAQRQLQPGESAEKVAAELINGAKASNQKIATELARNVENISPLDANFVEVALSSQRSNSYVMFDVWTSVQTHGPIAEYIKWLMQNYRLKRFHPDPTVNAKIHDALGKYFAESAKRRETHVFGYQVGYHALDPSTGLPLRDTVPIGEGAGMARPYLDASGRTDALRRAGKKTMFFENIELATDLELALGAHAKTGAPVSVIIVREKPGYTGGKLYKVQRGNETRLELLETSQLPPNVPDSPFFNTNSMAESLDLPAPRNIGFEVKNSGQGTLVRGKTNKGDVTSEAPTQAILGRNGEEYESFKKLTEYASNGVGMIQRLQRRWASKLN